MRQKLINFLEMFYRNEDVWDSGMDDILIENGATDPEDMDDDGIYTSMSNAQLEDASLQFLKLYGNKLPAAQYLFYLIMDEDNQADYIAGFEAACKAIGYDIQSIKDIIEV